MATPQQRQCESRHYFVGATIDSRYKLTEFIGAGGMACVYRAKEIDAPHEFALKFLKDEFHNLEYLVEYFEDEASSMRDLAHPNIVRFYRFVNRDSYSYIIMDYVDGFALSDVLKLARGKQEYMPLDEVVRVMTQVARALDAIHREEFVHRDIKPSNVLIARQSGQAFLTDLGITAPKNQKIEGAGTIAYMSPEQSETWIADQRSDVYSYGILIYEMLTGKRPFNVKQGLRGSEAEADLLRKHKESPVPKVTDSRRNLPSAVNDVIIKAMAKNPDDRYQTVIEFAQDMHQALLPKLSDDLTDFATIQHRQIAAPVPVGNADSQNMLRLLVLVGVAAIILASLIVFSPLIAQFTGPTPTPSETPTSLPTPTFTPTANPIEDTPVRFPFLQGVDAFAEPDSQDELLIVPNEGEVFNYLRVGNVNGFRVLIDLLSTDDVTRYGIAFRMQSPDDYYYFTVNPSNRNWRIIAVTADEEEIQKSGQLTINPEQISVSGLDDFFEIRVIGSETTEVIIFESDQYATGTLAIFSQDGTLQLDDLQVSLLGSSARTLVLTTATPSVGLADPLRFLRRDLNDMIATDNTFETTIDCPTYVEIYESLNRHLLSNNPTVVSIAQNAQTAGSIVYDRCIIESPDEPLSFEESIVDYIQWGADLQSILEELNAQ